MTSQFREAEQFLKLLDRRSEAKKAKARAEREERRVSTAKKQHGKKPSSQEDRFFVISATILAAMYLFLLLTGQEALINREVSLFMTSKGVIEEELAKVFSKTPETKTTTSKAPKANPVSYHIQSAHFDPLAQGKIILETLAKFKVPEDENDKENKDELEKIQNDIDDQIKLRHILSQIKTQESTNEKMLNAIADHDSTTSADPQFEIPYNTSTKPASVQILQDNLLPLFKINEAHLSKALQAKTHFWTFLNTQYGALIKASITWEINEQLEKMKLNKAAIKALQVRRFYEAISAQLENIQTLLPDEVKEATRFKEVLTQAQLCADAISQQLDSFFSFVKSRALNLMNNLQSHSIISNQTTNHTLSQKSTFDIDNEVENLQSFFKTIYSFPL